MLMPYYECPQFDICNCNKCPLDPEMETKESFPEEDKCGSTRFTRLKIVKRYPDYSFKYQGLTEKEWKRHNRSLGVGGKGLLYSKTL